MYNRILKRPMFKRGGPSYQAQGTGITSPFDTPRKQYQFGTSWEEIQENIRKSTADNTTTMQDVAQGFSYLANPYKDDGSAKTVGEMIWEGSQAVSGARGERKKTAQAGELAAAEIAGEQLKSDIAINQAQKEMDWKTSEADKQMDWKTSEAEKDRASAERIADKKSSDEYLKKTPLPRLILDMTTQILKAAVPGSFEYKNASGLAKGKAIAAKMAAEGITVGVIEDWVKTNDGWDYNADNMRSDMPWFDPTTNQWHVFNDNGSGYVTGDPIKSFLTVEEAVAYLSGNKQEIIEEKKTLEETNTTSNKKEEKKEKIKLKITTNLKGVDINDPQVIFAEAEKLGIKLVEPDGSKTWTFNLAENEMTLPSFKKLLEEKKMADTYAQVKPNRLGRRINKIEDIKIADKMAMGGVAGEDAAVTELDELNNWWKNQLASAAWNE
jgi:hypothetical protein